MCQFLNMYHSISIYLCYTSKFHYFCLLHFKLLLFLFVTLQSFTISNCYNSKFQNFCLLHFRVSQFAFSDSLQPLLSPHNEAQAPPHCLLLLLLLGNHLLQKSRPSTTDSATKQTFYATGIFAKRVSFIFSFKYHCIIYYDMYINIRVC